MRYFSRIYFLALIMAIMVYAVKDIFMTLFIATRMGEGGGEVTTNSPFASVSIVGLGTPKTFDRKKYSNTTMTTLRYVLFRSSSVPSSPNQFKLSRVIICAFNNWGIHHPQMKEGWKGPNLKQSQRSSRHRPTGAAGVAKKESVSLRLTGGDRSEGSGTVIS